MLVKAFLALILLTLSPYLEAEGHEVGANGDRVSAWFTAMGYQIYDELLRRETLGTPLDPSIKLSKFKDALKTKLVLVDEKNSDQLTNVWGELKDIKFTLDAKTGEKIILLERKTWTDLYDKKKVDYRTVFHAYLYASGLDDHLYDISAKLDLPPPTTTPLSVFSKLLSLDYFAKAHDGGMLAVEDFGNLTKLDANGNHLWVISDNLGLTSINAIKATADGNYVVGGNVELSVFLSGNKGVDTQRKPFVMKVDESGHILWRKDFCIKKIRDKNKPHCMGSGVVAIEENPSQNEYLLLLNEGSDPVVYSYVVRTKRDNGLLQEPSEYWEGYQLRSIRHTSDQGFLFAGFSDLLPARKEWNGKQQKFHVRKTDGAFRSVWEKNLLYGKAKDAVQLASGKIAVLGEKFVGVTKFPDIKSEPVLIELSDSGFELNHTSLFFADGAVENPESMGKSGRVDNCFVDAAGDLWISGSNNLFEREKRMFYFGDDGSYQLTEKNGFVYKLSASGEHEFRVFPGTSKLHILEAPDKSILMSTDRKLIKVLMED